MFGKEKVHINQLHLQKPETPIKELCFTKALTNRVIGHYITILVPQLSLVKLQANENCQSQTTKIFLWSLWNYIVLEAYTDWFYELTVAKIDRQNM